MLNKPLESLESLDEIKFNANKIEMNNSIKIAETQI